jgi:hypothetical protein
MSIFLPENDRVRVALPDDPENAIYIRPRMNMGQKNRVQGASLTMGTDGKTALNVGAGQNALMEVNFVAWEGPKFALSNGKSAPCAPKYQQLLDPNDPLVQLALKEINDRNKEAPSPDPNEAEPNGSTTDGDTP